jgi:hypothetical protein
MNAGVLTSDLNMVDRDYSEGSNAPPKFGLGAADDVVYRSH